MNTCIKPTLAWLDKHPKAKQWLWFVALWCGGLFTVTVLAYPIKWLMKAI
jgi:uncharacterized membrane protein